MLVNAKLSSLAKFIRTAVSVSAHWPFLSDTRRIVQKDLDIAEYTDPAHNPMTPYVIVLEPGLTIYKIYNGYWFFGRPTLEELPQDLRAVTKECRPDWDITTPELKAAWQQSRKAVSAGTPVITVSEATALRQVLPSWTAGDSTLTALMRYRRGLLPSVRTFVEYLAAELPKSVLVSLVRPGGPAMSVPGQ
jgi:hypothetical protein